MSSGITLPDPLDPLPIAGHLERWYGRPTLPETYLALDTETTGFSPRDDVITQIGYVAVKEGEVIAEGSRILDWSKEHRVSIRILLNRLAMTRARMTEDIYGDSTGNNFDFDLARLQTGEPPQDVIRWIHKHLWHGPVPVLMVGHMLSFDERMMSAMFERFLYLPKETIPDHRYFDTCGFAKASWGRPQVLPTKTDTARSFFIRAAAGNRNLRPPIKGAKLQECVAHFGWEKSGAVDRSQLHNDALEDSRATKMLYEECRPAIAASVSAETLKTAMTRKRVPRADDWH